jgi:hypothetical protein
MTDRWKRRPLIALLIIQTSPGCPLLQPDFPDANPIPFNYSPEYPVVGDEVIFRAPSIDFENNERELTEVAWYSQSSDISWSESAITADAHGSVAKAMMNSPGRKIVEMSYQLSNYYYRNTRVIPVSRKEAVGESLEVSNSGIRILITKQSEYTQVDSTQDQTIQLSALNTVENNQPLNVQFILRAPPGVSVGAVNDIDSGGSQYTSSDTIQPGETQNIGISITPQSMGNYEITGEVIYYFSDQRGNAMSETVDIPIRAYELEGSQMSWEEF